jgi:hypothetical protein
MVPRVRIGVVAGLIRQAPQVSPRGVNWGITGFGDSKR